MVPVDEDGRFTIDYLAPNRYTVYVTPIPAISPDETPAAPTEGIPEKYQSETTSDADFMILPGTNTLTIDLKP